MRQSRRPVWIALSVIACLVGAPAVAFAGEVSCDGFVLGYDGEAKKKNCRVEDTSRGNQESESRSLDVSDHAFFLKLTYLHTGFRTYVPAVSARDLLGELTGLERITSIGSGARLRGFDVIAFNAVPKGHSYALTCALFVRYMGNPGNYEFPGGPGAKNMISGIYCADPGFLSPAQQGQGFYGLIDQTIVNLRLPSAD